MHEKALFNNYKEFVLDTPINNLKLTKEPDLLILDAKWKIGKCEHETMVIEKTDALHWIKRNKDKIKYV